MKIKLPGRHGGWWLAMNKSIKKCFINGKWWYPYSVKHADVDGII